MSNTALRDKLDITEVIDIFTCEDIISSHVRISYRFYQFVTTRYTTDFYIIKRHSTNRSTNQIAKNSLFNSEIILMRYLVFIDIHQIYRLYLKLVGLKAKIE